eukprot:GAHX01000793.1.p1 GENE.GAHX01000793.1~~GAHX01000793.1.p1  ORF type:complete len:852 (-),score=192.28 GAHX01000793.1:1131-3638(-)
MPKYHLPKLPIKSETLHNSIYITSLPVATPQQQKRLIATIKLSCLRFGPILSFKAPIDTETKKLKGIILVEYKHSSSAFLAVYYLNDISLTGKGRISVKFVASKVPVDISQLQIPQSNPNSAPISYTFLAPNTNEEKEGRQDVLKTFLVEKEGCIKVKALTIDNKEVTMKEINSLDREYSYCHITKEKDVVSTLNYFRNAITFSKINKKSLKLEDILSINIKSPILGFNFIKSEINTTIPGSVYTLALFGVLSTQIYKVDFQYKRITLVFEIEHDYLDNNHNYFSFYTPHIGDKDYKDEYKRDSRYFSSKLLSKFEKENCNPLDLQFDKSGTIFRYNVIAHISLNAIPISVSPNILSVSKLMKITENKITELVVKIDELGLLTVAEIIQEDKQYKPIWDVYKGDNKLNKVAPIGDYETYCCDILKENRINFEVVKKNIKGSKDVSEYIPKLPMSPSKEVNTEDKPIDKKAEKKNEFVKHFVAESSNNILVATTNSNDMASIRIFNNKTLKPVCNTSQNKAGICDAVFKENFIYLRYISNDQLKQFCLENVKDATNASFSEKQLKTLWLNVLSDKVAFTNSKNLMFDFKFFLVSNKTSCFNFSLEEKPSNVKVEGEIDSENIYKKYTILVDVFYQKSTQTIFSVLKNPNMNSQIIKVFKVAINSLELTEKRDLLVKEANNTVISLQPNNGQLAVMITKNKAFIWKCVKDFEKADLNECKGSNTVLWDVCGLFFCVINIKSKADKGHEENYGTKVFTVGGNLLMQKQFIKVEGIREVISFKGVKIEKDENHIEERNDTYSGEDQSSTRNNNRVQELFGNYSGKEIPLQVEVIDVMKN